MSTAAADLLEAFAELTELDKREVASKVLRWLEHVEQPPLTDEELTSAADAVFQEYDQEETPGA